MKELKITKQIIKELNDFIAQSEGKETASSVEATEIKETPMQEEDGSTKKFMEIELTNSEKKPLRMPKEAENMSMDLPYISIRTVC